VPGKIGREDFDAVLFDLDGVLTATARIHAACWKQMFDAYLQRRAEDRGEPFRPFDIETDYGPYVDGKLRYEGVKSFLASRGIELPWGSAEDTPDTETVCGLGNRKQELVLRAIRDDGVETYPGSAALVRELRNQGLKTAVVSASKNCVEVLKAAELIQLFDIVVDGRLAESRRLPGKPAPDTFLRAAELLQVRPERAAVIEDAIAGVEAGRAGGFRLVIGVDRTGDAASLERAGAHLVVSDLEELLA
jgi:beta-phosphoglucomutase family hydrolase